MTSFSVLDLSPIVQGGSASQSFKNSLDLAQHAERWGYKRFWLAEHHGIPGVASAATSVVIAHVAGGTSTIRVGAGGIMLPNHPPLLIAEQFGTLETLFPGRIDLALGRAPGSDQATAQALRRSPSSGDEFPHDVLELMGYFNDAESAQVVRAVPGAGLSIPLWILGSSQFGASLAARLGLPFAFASHFAPAYLDSAIQIYRSNFRPSPSLDRPHLMLGVSAVAADTDKEASWLFTSLQQTFVNIRRGHPTPVPPPSRDFERALTPFDRQQLDSALSAACVGSHETMRAKLGAFIERTGADELIVATQIFDHQARLRSYEITAEIQRELAG
ncbi:MAG: LLM class flavin-dependent oxidoreductase [Gemmatimonadaceae bacterium]